eukprot:gb/GFBE01009373.1/.p1 GENE.gb/GFBE01009373.1/~~gb/GFBE01009373.1/.p1  ORF type:complete len:222 (+),score=44.40 gb/GFBE01009373.1/:1-666(+)
MQSSQDALETPQVVFGLVIANARLARLTRRVLWVAALSAILSIVSGALGMMSGAGGSSFVTIAVALLVPLCGYFGAKKSDPNLTCCFCGCNLLGGCCTLLTIFMGFVMLGGLKHIVEVCDPASSTEAGCPAPDTWTKMCPDLDPGYTGEQCYHHFSKKLPGAEAALSALALCSIPGILLQCLGFCLGNQLYMELKQGAVLVQPVVYPMAVNLAQPQPGQQV